MKRWILVFTCLIGLLQLAQIEAWAKNKKGDDKDNKGKEQKETAEEKYFKPEVLQRILKDNPDLPKDFLTHSLPDIQVKLSDGKTYPLYQLDQFLQANFCIQWYARQKEGEEIVSMMAKRLRRLMALPDFYERVMNHKPEYMIAPKGKVTAQEAYDHFRRCTARLGVAANKRYHAPVGGGSGIGAPSWATWKAMNLFEHETCHCIGIGHNSGGLSGPIAGTLRDWDKKKKWNYQTIDANTLIVTPAEQHAQASTEVGKVKKGKGGKGKQNGRDGKVGKDDAGKDSTEIEDGDDNEDDMNNDALDAGPETDFVIENDDAKSSMNNVSDGSGK